MTRKSGESHARQSYEKLQKQGRKTAASKQRKIQAGVNAKDRREGARKEKAVNYSAHANIRSRLSRSRHHPEPGHEHMIKSVVREGSRGRSADRRQDADEASSPAGGDCAGLCVFGLVALLQLQHRRDTADHRRLLKGKRPQRSDLSPGRLRFLLLLSVMRLAPPSRKVIGTAQPRFRKDARCR